MKLTLPIRISLLSLVITLTGVVTIALVAYSYSDTLLEQEELNALGQRVSREATTIQQRFETILEDAHFLNQSDPVLGIARALENDGYDDVENMTLDLWKQRLATLFSTVMRQREIYSQMRLLLADEKGRELVRVDRVDDKIITIPENKLQDKGHRDYFQAGLKLVPGEFHISRISLNREHGQITYPPTPMVRIIMPVYNTQRQLFALLVINANLLKIARNIIRNSSIGTFYFLANERGDYLIHPDPNKAMAFEYDREASIQSDYPALANLLEKLHHSTTDKTSFIRSLPESGIGLALNVLYYYPGHPDRFLIVGGVEELTTLKEKSTRLRDQLLLLVLLTSAVLAGLTFLLVRRLIQPLQVLNQAVEQVSSGKMDVDIPVRGHDEVATLAASFRDMLAKLSESQKALKEANLHLEQQVAERTRELEDAKHYLEQQNEQLTEALKKAQEADLAKSRFLAMMSHEVRTPLNGILGLTELALQQSDLPERVRDSLQAVHESGRTLLTILNDVLDFSKMEAGQLKLHPRPTDLNTLLEQVMRLYADMAGQKGIELYLHPVAELENHLIVDDDRLRQILMNLMSNAIKFTEQGHVMLRGMLVRDNPDSATLRLEVEDTGPGIAPEQRQRLFKEFSQLDDSDSRRHGGTGLGLSIAQRLVRMMGGQIDVISTPGEGATFWVELDLPKGEPLPTPPSWWRKRLQGRTLLVETDDDILRSLLESVLPHCGLTVRSHLSGEPFEGDALLLDSDRPIPPAADLPCIQLHHTGTPAGCERHLLRPLLFSQLLHLLAECWKLNTGTVQSSPPQGHDTVQLPSLRILMAEDVPVNQQVVIGMLSRLGDHQITVVENGLEAVRAYACGQFDLILMDLQMPQMDGYAALRAIREHEREHGCEPTPVVALTAHAMSDEVDSIRQAGFDDILTKPLSLDDLRGLLERIATRQPQQTHPVLDEQALVRLQNEVGDLEPLIELYLQELSKVADTLNTDDLAKLAEQAHRIKGSSLNMGAVALGKAARSLEQAARNGDTERARKQLEQFVSLIEPTRQALEQWRQAE